MRIRGLICIAVGLMLTAAAARAEEVTIVSGVLGPEGHCSWTGISTSWHGHPARHSPVPERQHPKQIWSTLHKISARKRTAGRQ